ncbi:hypothetical protein ACFL35_02850 [Candidatus Riflebacteria bacterium]
MKENRRLQNISWLPGAHKRHGTVALLMIFVMMVTSLLTVGLYRYSNIERKMSGTIAVESQLLGLAQASIERVNKKINDEMNVHIDGGSGWKGLKKGLFKYLYKPTAISLFYDLPKGKTYSDNLSDLDKELSSKVPGLKVDVKYEIAKVVPLGGKVSIKSLFKRHFPYINREKQATIVITAVATDGKLSRRVRAQKEIKIIDTTPPNATSAFTFDQITKELEKARQVIKGNATRADANKLINNVYGSTEREDKISTNDDLINGNGGAFPFSAKGYLAIEGWDTKAIRNFAKLKGSKEDMLDKFLFLPRGATTLLSKNSNQFRKRSNLMEWLSNVAPSKHAVKLKPFYFPDPFLQFSVYTPWVGFKVFGKKITIFPEKRIPVFKINKFRVPLDLLNKAGNMDPTGLKAKSEKLGDNFGSEGFGFSLKSFLKNALQQVIKKVISIFTSFGPGGATDAIDEEGGVKNFDIWKYEEGNVWALPKLWNNNGHLWGSIIDPANVRGLGGVTKAVGNLVSAKGATSLVNDGGFTVVIQTLVDLIPAEKVTKFKEAGWGSFKMGKLMNAALYPKMEGNVATAYFQFIWVPIVIIPGIKIPIPIVDFQSVSKALTSLIQLLLDFPIWQSVVFNEFVKCITPMLFKIVNPFNWIKGIIEGAKAFWKFIKGRVKDVLDALLNAKSVYGNFANGDKKKSDAATDDDADVPNLRNKEPVNANWEKDLWKSRATYKFKKNSTFESKGGKPMKLDGVYFVDGDVKIKGNYTGRGTIVATGNVTVTGDVKAAGDKDKLSIISFKKLLPTQRNSLLKASVFAKDGLGGDPGKKLKIHGNLVLNKLKKGSDRMRMAVVFDSNLLNKPVDLKSWFDPWSNNKAILDDGFSSYQISNK